MFEFIKENQNWIFSILGIFIILIVISFFLKKNKNGRMEKNIVDSSEVISRNKLTIGDIKANDANLKRKNIVTNSEVKSGENLRIGDES